MSKQIYNDMRRAAYEHGAYDIPRVLSLISLSVVGGTPIDEALHQIQKLWPQLFGPRREWAP